MPPREVSGHKLIPFSVTSLVKINVGSIIKIAIEIRVIKYVANDYIWVSEDVSILESGVCFDKPSAADPTLWPSDHAGVWADLEIAGPSKQPAGLE